MTPTRVRGAVLVIIAAALVGCGASPQRPETSPPSSNAPPSSDAAPAAPSQSQAEPAPTSWIMPDLVGVDLQDAQDAIQHLTGFAIAITYSHDASGAGRHQVLDRNWKVCSQNVAPGATITPQTRIDFGAVKLNERC